MEKPLVSIVTIVKDLFLSGRHEQIIQCIESVHKQTYRNYEHIIIDGASEDGTLDLLQKYVDLKWVDVYSEKDNGIYSAMNNGVRRCKGEFVLFLNSDDFFTDEYSIEHSVKALVENNADISFGNYRYLMEDGNLSFLKKPEIGLFFLRMPFCHQTNFTRVSSIKKINGFDESFRSSGDFDLVLRLILDGNKCVNVNEDLVRFRLGGFSSNSYITTEECVKSLFQQFSMRMPIKYEKVFYFFRSLTIDEKLFSIIRENVDLSVRREMDDLCKRFTLKKDSYRCRCFSRFFYSVPDGLEDVVKGGNIDKEKKELIISYFKESMKKRVRYSLLYSICIGNLKDYYCDRLRVENEVISYLSLSEARGFSSLFFKKYCCRYFEIMTFFGYPLWVKK